MYTNKKCYNDRPISHPYRWVFRKFTCSNLSIVCQSSFFFPRNTVVSHYLYHSSGIARFLCCLFVCYFHEYCFERLCILFRYICCVCYVFYFRGRLLSDFQCGRLTCRTMLTVLKQCISLHYCMADNTHGKDEANLVLWLAMWAHICCLGLPALIPCKKKIVWSRLTKVIIYAQCQEL